MKLSRFIMSICLLGLSQMASADDAAIKSVLQKFGITAQEIYPSPMSGIKAIISDKGLFYVSTDGKVMFQGPLYDISGNAPQNTSQQLLDKKVDTLQDQMVIYKAPTEKYVVTVFTDITCGYCRKLHKQMADYNALGITVRFLAFPREGLEGKVAKKMQAIWCSTDPAAALTAAMNNENYSEKPAKSCKADISQQYHLGLLYGLEGTPAILVEKGPFIPGYQSPKDLKAYLDKISAG